MLMKVECYDTISIVFISKAISRGSHEISYFLLTGYRREAMQPLRTLSVRELRRPAIDQRPTAMIGEIGKTLAKSGCNGLRGTIPVELSVG